jgi:CheY-like chemotaxis protein
LPQTGVIVISGRLDEREANEFRKLGVNAVVDKPFTQEKLVEVLKTIFHSHPIAGCRRALALG